MHKLATAPAHADRMAALRQRMETLLKAQGDPRMEGRGEKVETGWVNPTDFEKQSIKP